MLQLVTTFSYVCSIFNVSDYPTNISEIKSALVIQLTNQGLNQYVTKNIRFSGEWLTQLKLPDIEINQSGFRIRLQDIKVNGYQLPECQVQFKEGNADFVAKNMTIFLKSQFRINQMSYPYFEDGGTAVLKIVGIYVASNARLYFDKSCPLHYFIDFKDPLMSVDTVDITLDGKLAALYNSIMSAITTNLVRNFSTTLGPMIIDAINQIANDNLGDYDNFATNGQYEGNIGLDQQPINGTINSNLLTLFTVGQTLAYDVDPYTWDKHIYGYKNYNISQMPEYITNDHIQYKLHYLAFQSNFDQILVKNLAQQKSDEFQVTKVETKRFQNMGMQATVTIQHKKTIYTVESAMKIDATPFFYTSPTTNHTLIYITQIKPLKIVKNHKQIPFDDIIVKDIQKALNQLQTSTTYYGIQITNSNGIDACNVITVNEEWLHVGCMIFMDGK